MYIQVGRFHDFTMLMNLAVAMGLLGVAVTVDTAAEFLVGNFDDKKYDDRNDWMTLESLKAHALETGILEKFAKGNNVEILEDDVIIRLKEKALEKRNPNAFSVKAELSYASA